MWGGAFAPPSHNVAPPVWAVVLAFFPICATIAGQTTTFFCRLLRRMLLILLLRLALSLETTGGEHLGGDKCSVILSRGGGVAAANAFAMGSGIRELCYGRGISEFPREAESIG
jgi:hypothetical protein